MGLPWYKLLYYGTIWTENRLRYYRKQLRSDKCFTREDFCWFGKRIYELRLYRKEIGQELGRRVFNFLTNLTH